MTHQLTDSFVRDDARYSILEVDGNGLFSPHAFGLQCREITSACRRGYMCTYRLAGDRLQLDYLEVGHSFDGRYPVVGAAQPKITMAGAAVGASYEGVDLPVELTGRMRLAKDTRKTSHAGSLRRFATIVDAEFADGILLDWIDRSAELYGSSDALADPIRRFLRALRPTTTLPWLERTQCSLCGFHQRAPRIDPAQPADDANNLSLDREARPRHFLHRDHGPYVQECQACDHAAPQIGRTPAGLRDVVASHVYRTLRRSPHLPNDVNALCGAAYLSRASGQPGSTFWLWLRAAWLCDDIKEKATALMSNRVVSAPAMTLEPREAPHSRRAATLASPQEPDRSTESGAAEANAAILADILACAVARARLCRQMALKALDMATATGQTLGLAPARAYLLRAELLRRTQAFHAAREAVRAGYTLQPNLDLTRALRCTERLSERGDYDTPAWSPLSEECARYVAPWNVEEHEARDAPRRAEAARRLAKQQAEERAEAVRAARVSAGQANEADLAWYRDTPAGFIDACRDMHARGEMPTCENVPIGQNYRWLFLRNASRNGWPAAEWPIALAVAVTRVDPELRARAGDTADAWVRACAKPELIKFIEQFIAGTTSSRWTVASRF